MAGLWMAGRFGGVVLAALMMLAGAAALSPRLHAQAAASEEGPLTTADTSRRLPINNDMVVRMTKAGLDETVILQTIQTNPGAYNTAPDDLITLKNAGVSQRVIASMQAKSAGLATRPVTPAVDPVPLAAGIDEIGVYYKDKNGQWVPLKTERVQFRSGGWVKSTVTHNIVKQDLNGHLDGPKSQLQLPTGVQLMIYSPPGTDAEEYDFLRFREKKDAREFRVRTGGVFHSETGSERDEVEFHPTRVAKDMFTFTVPVDIEKGEYGVLPPGSSNMRGLSNAGKIFTFSIRE